MAVSAKDSKLLEQKDYEAYREQIQNLLAQVDYAMEENIKFVKAAVPEALIPNSYASGSAVAWVMYQKFANAMPLYRQEQDWHQLGVDFTRATLANWIRRK